MAALPLRPVLAFLAEQVVGVVGASCVSFEQLILATQNLIPSVPGDQAVRPVPGLAAGTVAQAATRHSAAALTRSRLMAAVVAQVVQQVEALVVVAAQDCRVQAATL